MKIDLHQLISDMVTQALYPRFNPHEVRNSLLAVAQRWFFVLDENERKKVSRILGGNKYAKTTYGMLNELFAEIVEEKTGIDVRSRTNDEEK